MDGLIFSALPIAAAIPIFEEYIIPGGFAKAFRKLLARVLHLFTVRFQLFVNGLFFLLCLISAFMGKANPVLTLSVFGLIFANAVLHIRGAIIKRGYYPGVISAVFI